MGLSGKKVTQMDIKCNGNVFHELIRYRPHDLSNITPDHIQGCELQEGKWGTVGSIINWNYVIDGKPQVSKQVIEAVDENNNSITFRSCEGDIMQIYKSFKVNLHVDKKGENSSVTWTLEYEKMNEDVPDPDSLIDIANKVTKDIETRQLQLQ